MFTLKFLDLEYKNSISIWDFEIMIVVLPTFQYPKRLYSQNIKENVFINEI